MLNQLMQFKPLSLIACIMFFFVFGQHPVFMAHDVVNGTIIAFKLSTKSDMLLPLDNLINNRKPPLQNRHLFPIGGLVSRVGHGDDHVEIVPHGWNPSRSNSRRSAKRRRFRPASDTFFAGIGVQ